MGFKVAVVGATGNVGREMLNILEERGFPVSEVVALASRRSQGTEVSFGDRTLKVKALETYDFSDTDISFMSAGGNVSREWAPKIGKQGCVVIDNSSAPASPQQPRTEHSAVSAAPSSSGVDEGPSTSKDDKKKPKSSASRPPSTTGAKPKSSKSALPCASSLPPPPARQPLQMIWLDNTTQQS